MYPLNLHKKFIGTYKWPFAFAMCHLNIIKGRFFQHWNNFVRHCNHDGCNVDPIEFSYLIVDHVRSVGGDGLAFPVQKII